MDFVVSVSVDRFIQKIKGANPYGTIGAGRGKNATGESSVKSLFLGSQLKSNKMTAFRLFEVQMPHGLLDAPRWHFGLKIRKRSDTHQHPSSFERLTDTGVPLAPKPLLQLLPFSHLCVVHS